MVIRLPRFLRRALAPFKWAARARDIDQEMAFHVEALIRECTRSGMSEAEAEREARRRFGSRLRFKEQAQDLFSARAVENFLRDIRLAGRTVRRSPGFALAVVLTLALGIGGNTAIFSVVDQLLLRPLPYPDGDRLVTIYEADLGSLKHFSVSPANWLDWQRQSRTLQQIATWRSSSVTLTGMGEPVQLNAQVVSSEFFPLLGVPPFLGRTVSEQDDRPNAPIVAVLSYQCWQTRFGGDPQVLRHVVRMNGRPVEIVGVMPASFRFLYQDTDLWTAARLDRHQPWRQTAGRFLNAIGRVRPGITVAAARTEMTRLAARLASTYAFNQNTTVDVVPLRQELTGPVHTALVMLYAAVGLLLAIACFNVASLLLARAASRQRDVAIRMAIGAGRLAIVRQIVVETVLFALAGGVLGFLLARWSVDALMGFAPRELLAGATIVIDTRVFAYAMGVSLVTGFVAGLFPALAVGRGAVTAWIHAGSRSITHPARVRYALLICQVSLTVLLLCGAGLLVRTLMALNEANRGFDTHDLLTMQVQLPAGRYNAARALAFYHEVLSALRAVPGVNSVAAANSLPVIGTPRGATSFYRLASGHAVSGNSGDGTAVIRIVSAGYFQALRVPVLQGREFSESDDANPTPGFVVNEAFARTFLSNTDPLRESLSVWMQDQNPYLPIIGVVGDVSEGSIKASAQPTVFYSLRQMPETGIFGLTLFLRGRQPTAIASAAIDAIHALDKDLAVTKIRTVEQALTDSVAREQLNAGLSAAFALSGLVLAALGVYGLLAFLVAERTKEIGLRITLGAQPDQLIRSVIAQGLRLVAIGASIGVGGALVLFRRGRSLLFGVTPYDVETYAIVLAILFAVAIIAAYIPANRAARVEPMAALRQD